MDSHLSAHEQATYDTIFRHPVSHNLEWHDLMTVLNHLGEVENEVNGKVKFSRNGHSLTLHARGKDVEVEDVLMVRHFLDASAEPEEPAETHSGDLILILDHKGASIYLASGDNLTPIRVVPEDPRGHDQQVHNPKGDSGGKQGPYRNLFYQAVAAKLENAERILVVGDAHGASSEAEHFIVALRSHHRQDLENRIIGTEVIDLHHLTEAELLMKAREAFSLVVGSTLLE